MTKEEFLNELAEALEVEALTETTLLEFSSLQILTVIVFADRKFDKQLKTSELKNIKSVSDLISLIGLTF